MEKNSLTAILFIFLVITLTSCTNKNTGSSQGFNSQNNRVAVLLPLHGKFADAGKRIQAGILGAFKTQSQQSSSLGQLRFYDIGMNSNITNAYQRAVQNGATFIIGPLPKNQVIGLSEQDTFQVPTLALNYSEQSNTSDNFYQFGFSPENEAAQIAERGRQDGRSRAIVIAPDTALGRRLTAAFNTRWQAAGGEVMDTWYYSKNRGRFSKELAALLHINTQEDKALSEEDSDKTTLSAQRRSDMDVIFLFAEPNDARLIVPLLKYYYADNLPIYATSSVYAGTPNPVRDADLNGVIVCDMPSRIEAGRMQQNSDKLYAIGRDAYLLSQTLPERGASAFPINGATGELGINNHHQIFQHLTCVRMMHGRL